MKLTAAAALMKIGKNIPDVAEHFIRAALGECGEGINPELAGLIARALGSSSATWLEAALEHRTGSARDLLLRAIALAKEA